MVEEQAVARPVGSRTEATEDQIAALQQRSRVENTDGNTKYCVGRFDSYRKAFNVPPQLKALERDDLLNCFHKVFASLKQINRKDYKTESLYNCFCALARQIKEESNNAGNLWDREDPDVDKVWRTLDGKMKSIADSGPQPSNASEKLSPLELQVLFQSPELSCDTLEGLSNQIFIMLGLVLSVRRGGHKGLVVSRFEWKKTPEGFDYARYHFPPDKNHDGGVRKRGESNDQLWVCRVKVLRTGIAGIVKPHIRIIPPDQIDGSGDGITPIADPKLFFAKRPKARNENKVIDDTLYFCPQTSKFGVIPTGAWYVNAAPGKNTLSVRVKTLCALPGVNVTEERLTNHGLRKTACEALVYREVK
ncbi:hypothetical protein HK097_001280 [Rhizophlyctis rosea]|uniref:DUF3504 domain-containing protein n=1 Tax=Rhizophlyctis rosea TaxID=64517 RepID=A0AAD5SJC3_9FUNG|nr:hypothetical protein HK097_001280 [Rhizophlyctis rosea]